MRPDVLLFDLGGVLIENAGLDELRRICPDSLDESEIRARWLASPSVRAFELGHITPGDFASRFVAEWNLRLPAEAFIAEFEHWPRSLFPGAEDLLLRLRSRQRVGCLSNSNALHWASRQGLRLLFDHVFLSHELGLIKPDPGIFRCAIERLGVAPDRIAFFDDSLPNVEAAAAAGIQAHHVVGLVELERTLTRLGLYQ